MHQPLPTKGWRVSSFARCERVWVWLALALSLWAAPARANELALVNEALPKATDQRLHAFLSAHKGKPVLINFWASWCQPCRDEMPALQRFAKRWQDKGLAVVLVAVADNARKADEFLWEMDVELPLINDPAQGLSRPWGARALPTTLVLDRKHRIRLRSLGAVDWESADTEQRFQPLTR